MQPGPNEKVCPVSFEIAQIRVGGGPDSRPGFWKAYAEELELNRRTGYRNRHVEICLPMLRALEGKLQDTYYFRHGRLVTEKVAGEVSLEPAP